MLECGQGEERTHIVDEHSTVIRSSVISEQIDSQCRHVTSVSVSHATRGSVVPCLHRTWNTKGIIEPGVYHVNNCSLVTTSRCSLSLRKETASPKCVRSCECSVLLRIANSFRIGVWNFKKCQGIVSRSDTIQKWSDKAGTIVLTGQMEELKVQLNRVNNSGLSTLAFRHKPKGYGREYWKDDYEFGTGLSLVRRGEKYSENKGYLIHYVKQCPEKEANKVKWKR
jgi:hypothetical protein